jgi:hypothetical protein
MPQHTELVGIGLVHRANLLLFPSAAAASPTQPGTIRCRERLGGFLKYYYRSAA